MKVMLGWSGYASHRVAQAFELWLPLVLSGAEPCVSEAGTDPSEDWFDRLPSRLETTGFCLFCVVRGEWIQPWLHREAGLMTKHTAEHRVATILVGLSADQIEAPFCSFAATRALDRDDVHQLAERIAEASHENQQGLADRFAAHWQVLQALVAIATDEGRGQALPGVYEPSVEEFELLDRAAKNGGREVPLARVQGDMDDLALWVRINALVERGWIEVPDQALFLPDWISITPTGRALLMQKGWG